MKYLFVLFFVYDDNNSIEPIEPIEPINWEAYGNVNIRENPTYITIDRK
jgi:hypothetical protein